MPCERLFHCVEKSISLTEAQFVRNMKKSFKSLSRSEIAMVFKEKQPLKNRLLEKGNIYKVNIYENQVYDISALEVLPGAKIAYHMHVSDKEYYIGWRYRDEEPCLVGAGHEFENPYNEKTLYILSIKVKVQK